MINHILYLRDKILKKPNLDNGFIEIKKGKTDYEHKPDDLGGSLVFKKPLLASGNWKEYRSAGYQQNRGTEKMQCVSASAANKLEQYVNYFIYLVNQEEATPQQRKIVNVFRQFGFIQEEECRISVRYIAKCSNTTRRGNNQQKVADTIRKYGLVPERDYGYVDPWNEYYKKIYKEMIDQGKEILKYIEFNYEWVNPIYFNETKIYGPIQTSVYAWGYKKDDIYQRTDKSKNHAVVNDYYVPDKYDGIFDTYPPYDKKVSWDFNLGWGMLYTISAKEEQWDQKEINKLMDRGLRYILKAEGAGEAFELTRDGLVHKTEKEMRDLGIKLMALDKILVGINNNDFYKLVK